MRYLLITLLASPLSVAAQITAAPQLLPRQTDPAFVGYISGPSGYSDSRKCDYPETLSTNDENVQCCKPGAPCDFYYQCQDNTLYGASGTSVPCDVSPELTCNTAIVVPATLAAYLDISGYSYLACWQTTLGTNPFTIVQSVPSGHFIPLTASGAPLTEPLSSSATTTPSAAAASASSTAASASLSTPTGALGEPVASPTLVTPSSAATAMSSGSAGASASSATAAIATGASTASSTSAAASSASSAVAASGNSSKMGGGLVAWLLTLMLSLL
ncbi:hypothetical protein B0A48_13833 [Cryoendolithus antarcticus]|uniref:Uncharacterized protein n=1 Tax=Cryoendolithus antarcticus TaxID=1507870 RepID=A0A1V8SN33_9PEZI|nr:hypothetical protein B0A48_13833 [Cryoendolithus antarcticus]